VTYLRRRLWYVDKDGQHWLEQDDLLARAEPLIVLGEPGMGKTELLKAIGGEKRQRLLSSHAAHQPSAT